MEKGDATRGDYSFLNLSVCAFSAFGNRLASLEFSISLFVFVFCLIEFPGWRNTQSCF